MTRLRHPLVVTGLCKGTGNGTGNGTDRWVLAAVGGVLPGRRDARSVLGPHGRGSVPR